jgi:hypothetical protein
MKGKILFSETQMFRYTWSWWLVLLIAIFMLGMFGYALYSQFILGEPWGTKPASDTGLGIVASLTLLLILSIFLLFHFMKLKVEIDAVNIYYSYFPFVNKRKTISKKDVDKIRVRKYNAIWEYGGWGYRVRPGNGKALNVKGKWGLQIVFKNDKKLLLGTQTPQLMKDAVEELTHNWNSKHS